MGEDTRSGDQYEVCPAKIHIDGLAKDMAEMKIEIKENLKTLYTKMDKIYGMLLTSCISVIVATIAVIITLIITKAGTP